MEIVYISPENFTHTDSNLNNIISINSNHYWDVDDNNDNDQDYTDLIYA